MRRQMTFLAMAALMQGLGTTTTIRPNADMGSSPFFMPSKSRRVKNKQLRLRKLN